MHFEARQPLTNNDEHSREGDAATSQAFGRVAGFGEDPLTWAIPLVTWRGVRIGVHAIFPIWALAECAAGVAGGWDAAVRAMTAVTCYAVVVLVRELARAWWAARAGRDVHEIIAWPLGGFSSFGAAGARSRAMGELGGLGLTAMLVVPVGGFLWALGGSVLDLGRGLVEPWRYLGSTRDPIEGVAFWMFHALVMLTAFHALVPMSPFDLSRALDRGRADRHAPVDVAGSALRRGVFVAFALFTGAAVAGQERLMAVAVLGGLTTWIEYRRVMFLHRPLHRSAMVDDRAAVVDEADVEVASVSKAEEHGVDPNLDEVLAKITRSGMVSLSMDERRALEEATRRSRREGTEARARMGDGE